MPPVQINLAQFAQSSAVQPLLVEDAGSQITEKTLTRRVIRRKKDRCLPRDPTGIPWAIRVRSHRRCFDRPDT